MSGRLSHEEFEKRVNGFGCLIVLDKYINSATKIRFKCTRHGNISEMTPDSAMRGTKMRCCSAEDWGRLKFTRAASKYKKKCEDQGRLLVVEDYKGARVPIYHFCKEHKQIYKTTPNNVLSRGGGLKCCRDAKSKERGKSRFEKCAEEYRVKLSLMGKLEALEDYKGNKEKILHRCLIHGKEGMASPSDALQGKGLYCCKEAVSLMSFKRARWYVENYPRLCEEIGKVKPLEEYGGLMKKIMHLCLRHNQKHLAKPNHVLDGHGLSCCNDGGDSLQRFLSDSEWENGDCYFYVAEISGGLIKPGIALNPEVRADDQYLEFLFVSPKLCRAEAWTIEQYILRETSFASPKLIPEALVDWDGKSELRDPEYLETVWIIQRFNELLEAMEEVGWLEVFNKLALDEESRSS